MASPLSPHFVLVQEDFNLNYPVKLVYRAQSGNFNYVFNQGLMLKRREPMKHVGIVAVAGEVVPFMCKLEDCHLIFISFEEYLDPKDYILVPGALADDPDDYPF